MVVVTEHCRFSVSIIEWMSSGKKHEEQNMKSFYRVRISVSARPGATRRAATQSRNLLNLLNPAVQPRTTDASTGILFLGINIDITHGNIKAKDCSKHYMASSKLQNQSQSHISPAR